MADEIIDIRYILNPDEVERSARRIDAAIGQNEQSTTDLAGVTRENVEIQKQVLKDLERQYKELEKTVKSTAPGMARVQMEGQLTSAKAEIEAEKKMLTELSAAQKATESSTVSLRTQLMNQRNAMARMTEGSQEYIAAMHKLGELQDQMGDIQQQGRVFADDERYFRTATEAVQGLAGAMSVGVGVATLFGASQENLAKIQARLQAVMAISIGVQQIAQVLNKDSYVSHILLAKAKTMVATATTRLSVALGVSNVAAKALMATLTLGLSVAISAVVWAIDKMITSSQEAEQKQKDLADAAAKTQQQFNESVATSVSKQVMSLKKLQDEWSKLSQLDAQKKFIKDNKSAFDDLGVSISSVKDAENLLVNNTDTFIASIKAKAMALAYSDLAAAEYQKVIENQLKKEQRQGTVTDDDRQVGYDNLNSQYKGKDVMGRAAVSRNEDKYVSDGIKQSQAAAADVIQKNIDASLKKVDGFFNASQALFGQHIEALKKSGVKVKVGDGDNGEAVKDHTGEVREAMLKAEQMKINIMQEGRIKELAQIEQTRKEKLAALDKEQKEIEAKLKEQGKKLSPEETATFADQRNSIGVSADQGAAAVNKKYDDEISDHWKALTSVFLSEEQKRTGAIKDRYDQEREWADKAFVFAPVLGSVVKMQIDASEEQEVNKSKLKEYEDFTKQYLDKANEFRTNITNLETTIKADRENLISSGASKSDLQQFDERAQQQLDSVSTIQTEMLAQLDEQIGIKNQTFISFIEGIANAGLDQLIVKLSEAEQLLAEAQLNNGGESAEKVGQYQAQIAILKQQIVASQDGNNKNDTKTDPLKKHKATLKAVTELGKAAQDIAESFDGLDGNISDIMKSAGKLSSSIGALLASIVTMSVASQTTVTTTSIVGMVAISTVSTTAAASLKAVEGASVILAIIGAALQIVMAIADALAGVFNDDKAREAEIQRLQGEIDALTKSYEALEKAIDKAYSVDASNLIEQSDELLRKQRALINQQIREEEGKKDSDGGQIDEWRNRIEEIDAQLEENREKAVDVIFGSDVESAIDDFASAYMDAWAAGEDRAQAQKDVVKNMIRGIIQEMLKSDIKEQVEAMRKKIAGFMEDDVLSDDELAQIDTMGEQIGKIMEQRGKMYDKILKDEESKNEDSFTGAIRGTVATEASVAELKGYYAGQFDKLASIDNRLAIGFQGLVEMARTNAQIEANTRATAANTAATVERLTAGFGDMSAKLTNIDNNTKKDNGSY